MSERVQVAGLSVDASLFEFVDREAIPGSGVDGQNFWDRASSLIHDLAPRNRELLRERDELQARIDDFHKASPGQPDPSAYKAFLYEIGYLLQEPADFTIETTNVDDEITGQAGPQLVVPLLNARFAANAANARWGSLYDALYGTDAIAFPDSAPRGGYDADRGAKVIARGREFLNSVARLDAGSHFDVVSFSVDDDGLRIELAGNASARLADRDQFVGYTGEMSSPRSILLVNNNLHVEIQIDPSHAIGGVDRAGIKDIVLESAVTAIMDLEDSVAAVDAEDKTLGYRNWLELNKGSLTAEITKDGVTFTRSMNPDRTFTAPSGTTVTLPGRALMFVRQVGHLMTTDAVLDREGNPVPEGILDALITGLGSLHDLRGNTERTNSRAGSMYIVKPKMHGPAEVAFTVELLGRVEEILGMPPLTMKLGIMDEERRTTVNLKACIAAAKDRVAFINTGFLDRTGDEIHTSLHAGPFVRKGALKAQPFMRSYEDWNVDTALAAGFQNNAQIGKGMWAMPNLMAAMLAQKSEHPEAGASTAWVPSPAAATLHSLHYHETNVTAVQDRLRQRRHTPIDPILEIPLAVSPTWTAAERHAEVDNNVQSILGYVVRWVDHGIGCSTVPDIDNVGLMEDRATLRISSQLLANWLAHQVISEEDILESLHRIAPVVDAQNANDTEYELLVGPTGAGLAFECARDLILLGAAQPNGYTEPILHRARRAKKATIIGG